MNQQQSIHDQLNCLHNNNVMPEQREIFLHSYFDGADDSGVDYRASVVLEKNIRFLSFNSQDPILIHMLIPGGDWEDCLSMYDTLKLCKCQTTILGYGKIQSASG